MNTISDQQRENLILFPKSIDYYQIELTRMLETERYQEAKDMLRFLLQCATGDPRADQEWAALLAWLETMSITPATGIRDDEEDKAENERDLFRLQVEARNQADAGYVQSLLDTLSDDAAADKQMLAIEQLSWIDHPDINGALTGWLESSAHYPGLQFRVLQALKNRGAQGTLSVVRPGGRVQVEIESIPLSFSEYPASVQAILHRVQQACEVNDPGLGYFAEEMWGEFLAFAYGTGVYQALLSNEEKDLELWAAALHQVLSETMSGSPEETAVIEFYDMKADQILQWRQACQVLRSFISATEKM